MNGRPPVASQRAYLRRPTRLPYLIEISRSVYRAAAHFDVAARALRQARARCRNLDHVHFQKMQVPERFLNDTFDLILLSEVGYYWFPADLSKARRLIAGHLASQGTFCWCTGRLTSKTVPSPAMRNCS